MNAFKTSLKYFLSSLIVLSSVSCIPDKQPETEPETPGQEIDAPSFETSYEAVRNMGVGWNLGNTLDTDIGSGHDGTDWELWETGWGQPVTTPELMMMMKEAGFGAIRVPVTWGWHMDADGKVYDSWMNRVNEIVDYVIDAGLYCIINIHHDTGADENDWLIADPEVFEEQKETYACLWKQIAERFRDYDHHLLFESYNEMLDSHASWCYASYAIGYDAASASASYEAINAYAQLFVDTVRSTGGNNLSRNLIVNTYGACNGAGSWNPHLIDPLKYMKKPADTVEDHLIFQVHAYPMIDNIPSMKNEMNQMFSDLNTYLASQGGPVIIGEWGTFSENPSLENMLTFVDYFVNKAKQSGMGTFYWMGLSDGMARSIPVFNHPEIAEAIVKAYHGDSFQPKIPKMSDYEYEYVVTYNNQWSELHLCNRTISLSDYVGISFELDKVPANGELHVKIYGESDGKEQYESVSAATATVTFKESDLGGKLQRVTLQYTKTQSYTITVKNAYLIRKDGSLEKTDISSFWGCDVFLRIVS